MATSPILQIVSECQAEGLTPQNAEKIAVELARIFKVRGEEVGILRLENDSLVFVYPAQLHNVGRIPLNASGSVAVRTAQTRRGEIINSFARTRHAGFFEMAARAPKATNAKNSRDEHVIQKLMSAPVLAGNEVLGVIQLSRKGPDVLRAGPDFLPADLQKLVSTAGMLARCFK